MKYYRGLLFLWGGGEVCVSLVWISKATVLCIEEERGTDPGFFNGGWLIPIFIGHQTIHLFILSCPTFVPKHAWQFRKSESLLASQGFCDPRISIFLGLPTYFHLFIQVLYGG